MVTTRRKTRMEPQASKSAVTTSDDISESDTIHIQRPSSPLVPRSDVPHKRDSRRKDHECNSVANTEVSNHNFVNAINTATRTTSHPIKRRKVPVDKSNSMTQSLTLSRPQTGGSAHNPIEISESPLRRKHARPSISSSQTGPHMFQDRHRSLYRCGTDRRALLPKPANGSIFTGHKSHDMYRMMNAKQAAHGLTPARLPTSLTDEASIPQVGLQYPLSTHYLPTAQVPPYQYWPTASAYASHQHHTPYLINANMPYDIQIEHSLRRRALQYVRQHSRPRSASNPVCVAPDETSGPKTDTKNSQPSLRPRRSNAKACSQDRLQTLIAQTSLLTSLLQVYPASVDQDKLREDISTLASTHAEYMKAWIETSGTCSKGRKRMRSDTDSAIDMADIEPESPLKEHARGMVAHVNESMRVESERRKERGEELMKIMRSNAEIWGKHGGSIVDAFGDKEQEETGEGEESEASHERSQAGQVDECDDDDGESEDEL